MAEPGVSHTRLESSHAGFVTVVLRSVLQKSICEPYFIEAAEKTLVRLFYEVGTDAEFAHHPLKIRESGDGGFKSWRESQILAATTSTTTNDDDRDTEAVLFHSEETDVYV